MLPPSLAYGEHGPSARLFNVLASQPLWLLPGRQGGSLLQPVLCWLPVVWIQIRLRDLAVAAACSGIDLAADHMRPLRWWEPLA